MSEDPDFLTVEDVLLLHGEQLARDGGASGVRDPGALDSAVAMPRATFDGVLVHQDLYAMAAAYAFHIAQNQPFLDGNKRTGLAAALVFLDINGITIADPAGGLYGAMIDLLALGPLTRDLSITKSWMRREATPTNDAPPLPPSRGGHPPLFSERATARRAGPLLASTPRSVLASA